MRLFITILLLFPLLTYGQSRIPIFFGTGCTTPTAISGTTSACVGSTAQLSSSAGGTWSSGSTSIATIGSTGIVTGVASGTSTITYSAGQSCYATTTFTVNANPASISGTLSVSSGSTTQLTDATAGGMWSSASTSIATIGTAGLVTGVSAGTSTISYTLSTGCYATAVVTVTAAAGIAYVTGGSATSSTATVTTSSINASAGNLIVVAVFFQSGTTGLTITDNQSHTYVQDKNASNPMQVSIYRCYASSLSSSLVIKATGSLTYTSLAYAVFSGSTGSTVDVTQSNVGTSTSFTGFILNLTPTSNNEVVVVAANTYATSGAPTSSGGGGYNLIANSAFTGTTYAFGMWYQIQTTATATSGGTISNLPSGTNFASAGGAYK